MTTPNDLYSLAIAARDANEKLIRAVGETRAMWRTLENEDKAARAAYTNAATPEAIIALYESARRQPAAPSVEAAIKAYGKSTAQLVLTQDAIGYAGARENGHEQEAIDDLITLRTTIAAYVDRAVQEAVEKERERWLGCAEIDPTMEGPTVKRWNRSALDRLRAAAIRSGQ